MFALVASCLALADESADWPVNAPWNSSCACPALPTDCPLALVASCLALADESAHWPVNAPWNNSCACPEPPQPAPQLSLLDWLWLAPWVVSASLDAFDLAEFSAACGPP